MTIDRLLTVGATVVAAAAVAIAVLAFTRPLPKPPAEVSPGRYAIDQLDAQLAQVGQVYSYEKVNRIYDDGSGHILVYLTVRVDDGQPAFLMKVELDRAPYQVLGFTAY